MDAGAAHVSPLAIGRSSGTKLLASNTDIPAWYFGHAAQVFKAYCEKKSLDAEAVRYDIACSGNLQSVAVPFVACLITLSKLLTRLCELVTLTCTLALTWLACFVTVCHLHRFLFDGDHVQKDQTPEEVSTNLGS